MSRGPTLGERAQYWIADHPMSIPGRIAALRFGRPPRNGPVPVVRADDSPVRVLIAPANYAGQAYAWRSALRATDPSTSARNYALERPPFAFPADAVIPASVFHNSRRWQREQLEAARGFTHLLVESFIPPFGRLLDRDLGRQIDALGPAVSVALMCHGSDVRRPSVNREQTALAPFTGDAASMRAEQLAIRNIDFAARSGLPVFVSTPDLLEAVPGAQWCPVVVDLDRWSTGEVRNGSRGGAPRVVHAPSSRGTKGTAVIEPVAHDLHRRGIIDYRPLSGIPHAEMPAVLAESDIVVDQLSVGSYGVAACEAMAAGRPVVGHVRTAVRDAVRDSAGLDLPIVEADASSLERVLTELASDVDRRDELGRAGRRFVETVHDGRRSAETLRAAWIGRSAR
ncbi:glycosyltransferase [Microbacterium sp.]|uniref:glycosyltransferase n=1 Tax=Microbacterium sp. TaxID=51671 RepID=UPI002BA31A10|nr:glycosyltransferase [Microbacterium sp.]HWL77210.1 glycosyltransferase [Microbacterium sp.]